LKYKQLHFTLALVELQVYELAEEGEKQLLIMPQVVARTKEITRAVVRVEGKAIESVQVTVDTKIETGEKPQRRGTLTEDEFFDRLKQNVTSEDIEFTCRLIKDMQELGCAIDWKQGSFVVKLPDPGGGREQAMAAGHIPSGFGPKGLIGYDWKDGHFVKNAIAPAVEFMLCQYLEDYSESAIMIQMKERGFLTKAGKSFAQSTVSKVLHHARWYAGVITWKGKEFTGLIEPMIEEEEAEQIQARLRAGTRPGGVPTDEHIGGQGGCCADCARGGFLFPRVTGAGAAGEITDCQTHALPHVWVSWHSRKRSATR